MTANGKSGASLADATYRAMAEYRYQIRRFIRFSEAAAAAVGVEPQQHLLLLAIRGLPEGMEPSISTLASRLMLKHHSVVELLDRSERMGLVRRQPHRHDRRLVLVLLTPKGERLLDRIFSQNREQLRAQGAELIAALRRINREQAALERRG